jgi:aminoglycoside phosphotransferase family enzyme/predicted kinase
MVDNQADTIAYLAAPGNLDACGVIERRDTHASVVFLTPQHAYKLKRAVRFDYLDYSTVELRRRACETELAVNRRTAPGLYLGVVPVTRQADGTLAIDGSGQPVDWLVMMRRFDDRQLLDALAARGALPLSSMAPVAEAIRALHEAAEFVPGQGGSAGMSWVVDGNEREFAALTDVLDRSRTLELTRRCRAALRTHETRLETRRLGGWVRRCHGDLHLGNVVWLDGRPVLFDAIEFSDAVACVDVWYDVAFMLMDLVHRRLDAHAHAVFQRYVEAEPALDGLSLLPLFLACRAAIRAKTSAEAVRLVAGDATLQRHRAREYLDVALTLSAEPCPALLAVGGWSGSGKSTVAGLLAPMLGTAPGAVIVSSDVTRKRLAGVPAECRLPASAYSAEANRRVYAAMRQRAADVLATGRTAVIDAVHARSEDRDATTAVASQAGVPFAGVWLDATLEDQAARIRARTGGPSDATAAVLETQRSEPLGTMAWRRIDTSGSPSEASTRAREAAALLPWRLRTNAHSPD